MSKEMNENEAEVTNDLDVLPETDKSFCFSGHDFANESFSVDLFLKTNRSKVSLEQLKDDLNSYLRVLKTSMIELINEDYNDFVNLSTNLMGFDKAINNLSQPLIQLRDQSLTIEQQFNELIHRLETQMKRLQSIRQNKSGLNKIISISKDIERAEKWFNYYISSDNQNNCFSSVEKIALIVIKIEMQLKSIESDIPYVRQQLIPRFDTLSNGLNQTLESGFFSAITSNDTEELNSILRIYSLNGKHMDLELMFRQKVVKPYMNEVINETFLNRHGINRFFDEILQFIDLKCQLIIGLKDTNYSFVINSVWTEVSNCLIVRTPSLFSSGNPDIFHSQYCLTNDFIDQFIAKSGIERCDLERHPNYRELINKFNVEVYFHIRFQQMATKFESVLEEQAFQLNSNQNKYKFFVTQTLYECLTTCWSSQTVYISALFSSFWRITVQMLSRYTFWLQHLNDTDIKGSTNETMTKNNRLSNKTIFLGFLINDCKNIIIDSKEFFESTIIGLKPSIVSSEEFRQSFDESIELLERNGLSNVVSLIQRCLIEQCDQILRQVNDLPRLYRKTNKEVPTKASNYINNCFDLIASITSNETQIWRSEWTRNVLNEITSHFKQFTSEVLTSVQKIEDSLKRLKKAKVGQNSQIKNNPNNVSDDHKIRLQIYFDVLEFGNQIEEKLKIDKNSVKCFTELFETTNATKNLMN